MRDRKDDLYNDGFEEREFGGYRGRHGRCGHGTDDEGNERGCCGRGHGHEGGCRKHGMRGAFLERMEEQDELTILFGKCVHKIFGHPHRGRGQGRILKLILASGGEMTQGELQEKLGTRPGSVSEIVSKLVNRGMLTRDKDEDDKRKVVLRLTEQGREKAEHCHGEDKSKDAFAALSDQEKETLKSLLKKLLKDDKNENAGE